MSESTHTSQTSSSANSENEASENSDVPELEVMKKKTLVLGKSKELSKSEGSNIIKYHENQQYGKSTTACNSPVKESIMNYIKTFRVAKSEAPFVRRVTYIEWHPTDPYLFALASKGGDIILWNCEISIANALSIKGIGAGGYIQAMKFDSTIPHKIYTVSIEGKFLMTDFITKEAKQYLETLNLRRWYVSLDINWNTKTMVVGDNKGGLTVMTTDGEVTTTLRAHRMNKQITNAEFSKRESWLLCTSSTDKTVKLWDIRQLKRNEENVGIPLETLYHEKPINSAYFSSTDGCRLLTTDQYDKIYVYRSPLWYLETEISHPHRQYQHLTPIRATWHPYQDIILVGRYPFPESGDSEKKELRTIDFFDAETGELLHQHSEPGFDGIPALNKFNVSGDILASGSGCRILMWKPKIMGDKLSKSKKKDDKAQGPETSDSFRLIERRKKFRREERP